MPKRYTPRGFAMYEEFTFEAYQGDQSPRVFTVQESSLATERKVWIGSSMSNRAHLNVEEARKVRDALTEFLGDGE